MEIKNIANRLWLTKLKACAATATGMV